MSFENSLGILSIRCYLYLSIYALFIGFIFEGQEKSIRLRFEIRFLISFFLFILFFFSFFFSLFLPDNLNS